jgi:hypothetical protein
MPLEFALVLGIALLFLLVLWPAVWRFERRTGNEAERLVRDGEHALSTFQIQSATVSSIKHRHRDGRHRRRRRNKNSGSESN